MRRPWTGTKNGSFPYNFWGEIYLLVSVLLQAPKKKQFFRELGWTYGGSFAGDSHDIIAGLEESPFHPYTWSPNARGKCRIKNNNIKRKHSLPYPGSEIIVFLYVGSLKKELWTCRCFWKIGLPHFTSGFSNKQKTIGEWMITCATLVLNIQLFVRWIVNFQFALNCLGVWGCIQPLASRWPCLDQHFFSGCAILDNAKCCVVEPSLVATGSW